MPNGLPPGSGAPADGAQAALAAAGNLGVGGDQASSVQGDADRRAHALDAARKFPENEAQSSQQFQQLAQMLPQMASGIAGSLTGALGGVMGPLTQLPQQAMQAAQSAIQPLMGAAKGGEAAAALTDMSAEDPGFGGAGGGDAGLGGGGGGGAGLGGGTTPTGFMGPPPVPSSSPPTTPASASAKPVTVTQTGGMTPQSGPMGMTGMPMMPGAMGAGGDGNKDKPAEKRVTVPGIPNGQPVKGRLTAPPSVPVTKSEGKPPVVAKPNRRIVIVPTDEEPKE
ncbi:hypothetical protein A9X00_17385 [Mycobacterium sp. 1245805.9]|nr:hypothetical protein [Mycobacterium sp. 1245805.9]OBI91492.1 hypothetical protein A9X00_17385 [Mycobacterium sp. 1245805.9]